MSESASVSEAMSAGDLRIEIGRELNRDLHERVNSVGNSRAAVRFRKATLVSIAHRIPNRRGDAQNISDKTTDELREFIALNLDLEAPPTGSHLTWIHLKAIYEEVAGE